MMRSLFREKLPVVMLLLILGLVSPVLAETIGTVRYVEVIAAHPRMLKFDFTVGRFTDGASAQVPLAQLQEKESELETRLQKLQGQITEEVAVFEKSLASSGAGKRLAEKEFWAKKAELDQAIEVLRDEIAANIAAMEFGGRTIETLVVPEVNQIMLDVNAAINNAARAHKCTMVLSEPLPLPDRKSDRWIEEGYSMSLRNGNLTDGRFIRNWVASADLIAARLGGQVNMLRPVITGSVDLTEDAIRLLTQPARKGGALRK